MGIRQKICQWTIAAPAAKRTHKFSAVKHTRCLFVQRHANAIHSKHDSTNSPNSPSCAPNTRTVPIFLLFLKETSWKKPKVSVLTSQQEKCKHLHASAIFPTSFTLCVRNSHCQTRTQKNSKKHSKTISTIKLTLLWASSSMHRICLH